MALRVALDYGRKPYLAELPEGSRVVRAPTPAEPPPSLGGLLRAALDAPIGAERLELVAAAARRVLLVVSDPTRREPREELASAILERLPTDVRITLAVATGTHGPAALDQLGLGDAVLARVADWVNHDGADAGALVSLGTTPRGTPVTVNRAVLDADLIVATGAIIPHYFAGYGAGIKAIFPGLGGSREVRINHRLKEQPTARAGVVDGNPCREDLDDVADLLPHPVFLLDVVVDDHGDARAAVAGDVRAAFRAGARACEPLYRVRAPRSRCVVASGGHPVTASLYQASKLVAAAAPLVAPGGTVILVAECGDGTGPLDVVNQGIYEIGLKPRLPAGHRVVLVSSLPEAVVALTYCEHASTLEAALAQVGEPEPVVLPRAGSLLCEAEP